MSLAGALLAATVTVTLTPAMAVDQGREIVRLGLGQTSDVQLHDVVLRSIGGDMLFCGKVNIRSADGSLSGWRDLLVVVSGNPNDRTLITSTSQLERSIIGSSCSHGARVDGRDYSAALNPR